MCAKEKARKFEILDECVLHLQFLAIGSDLQEHHQTHTSFLYIGGWQRFPAETVYGISHLSCVET